MNALIKKLSAWLPVAMSLGVLGIMLISFAMFGIPVREQDEGTIAAVLAACAPVFYFKL